MLPSPHGSSTWMGREEGEEEEEEEDHLEDLGDLEAPLAVDIVTII